MGDFKNPNSATATFIPADHTTGNVAYYDIVNEKGYKEPHQFIASGWGSQHYHSQDPNALVYVYNREAGGVTLDAERFVDRKRDEHNIPYDHNRERQDSDVLSERFYPIARRSKKELEIGQKPLENGLHVVYGPQFKDHIVKNLSDASGGFNYADYAKLYVAGFDEAARIASENYLARTQHTRADNIAQEKARNPGHSKVYDVPKELEPLLDSAEFAVGNAMLVRSLEIAASPQNTRSDRNENLVSFNVTDMMRQLVANYATIAGERMTNGLQGGLAHSASTKVTGQSLPIITISGIAGNLNGPILFEHPLQLRLSRAEKSMELNKWVLFTEQKDPYNSSVNEPLVLARGDINQQGLRELFEVIGKQRFKDDVVENPDFASSKSGKLFTEMVDKSFEAVLKAEADLGITTNALTYTRNRKVELAKMRAESDKENNPSAQEASEKPAGGLMTCKIARRPIDSKSVHILNRTGNSPSINGTT